MAEDSNLVHNDRFVRNHSCDRNKERPVHPSTMDKHQVESHACHRNIRKGEHDNDDDWEEDEEDVIAVLHHYQSSSSSNAQHHCHQSSCSSMWPIDNMTSHAIRAKKLSKRALAIYLDQRRIFVPLNNRDGTMRRGMDFNFALVERLFVCPCVSTACPSHEEDYIELHVHFAPPTSFKRIYVHVHTGALYVCLPHDPWTSGNNTSLDAHNVAATPTVHHGSAATAATDGTAAIDATHMGNVQSQDSCISSSIRNRQIIHKMMHIYNHAERDILIRVYNGIDRHPQASHLRINHVAYNRWAIVVTGINISKRSYFAMIALPGDDHVRLYDEPEEEVEIEVDDCGNVSISAFSGLMNYDCFNMRTVAMANKCDCRTTSKVDRQDDDPCHDGEQQKQSPASLHDQVCRHSGPQDAVTVMHHQPSSCLPDTLTTIQDGMITDTHKPIHLSLSDHVHCASPAPSKSTILHHDCTSLFTQSSTPIVTTTPGKPIYNPKVLMRSKPTYRQLHMINGERAHFIWPIWHF